jgi:rhomboid protease GluP
MLRKTSGSMVCPNCGKLIGVGEERCPFCGAWRPGLFGFTPSIQRFFGNRLDVIAFITAACVVLYALSLLLQRPRIFGGGLEFLSPGNVALWRLGMTGGVAWQEGWWWTLLTANYLHGGLLHIVFNVMWIRQLGTAVVDVYGPARAFTLFSIAGAAGFLLSNVAGAPPTVGASASIFGLLAALIVYGRRVGSSMLTAQMWQWAIVMFALGFLMSHVNNWAHAGGFAGGWVVAEAMGLSHSREGRGVQLLALALLFATVAGFVLSFARVTAIVGLMGM